MFHIDDDDDEIMKLPQSPEMQKEDLEPKRAKSPQAKDNEKINVAKATLTNVVKAPKAEKIDVFKAADDVGSAVDGLASGDL